MVGASCPLLKSFKFNNQWYRWPREESNDDAFAIAGGTMHDLCHLQLLGNKQTNDGLRTILDRYPHLESLDLRQCFNLKLGGKSGRIYAKRIKKLRLLDDPIDNSELVDTDSDYGSYDKDNPSAFPDVDSMFDDEEYEFSYGNDYEDYDMGDHDVYPLLF
ncbi:hypothetical protein Pyn_05691 [Prunus yedoensis var. nudiflora]|uniref:F-box protein SKIP19-like n=1 Tax=Prunus yedoensis var. nudiflora TaxID=2094558 RepID=A0A314UYN0_PRUYE|nr:hypothetical protein Pyn_05691 [Prunus yedoensis var. nudiflora]